MYRQTLNKRLNLFNSYEFIVGTAVFKTVIYNINIGIYQEIN